MKNITQRIDQIHLLPNASKTMFLSKCYPVQVIKGTQIISAGKLERYVYFIEKGIARAWFESEDKETTIWFGQEGDMALSFLSLYKNEPGYECIEVLEDSLLYRISIAQLLEMYATDINLANWGRKLAEQELLKTEQRFMDLQFKTATQRYQDLIRNHATILKRVQLKYVASYLGITQVSLSRIRSSG